MSIATREDILRRVDFQGECWVWLGSRTHAGYGRARFNRRDDWAHRVSWKLFKGEIPEGLCVLHKCDNRPCCNPDHLFLGTKKDNTQDMVRKGRSARGERHGSAQLTAAQVVEIRTRAATGETQRVLAKAFGIDQAHVSLIVRGATWREAGGPTRQGMTRSDAAKRTHRRQADRHEFAGVRRTLAEWSAESGVSLWTLYARLARGWTLERSLTEAVHPNGRKRRGDP